MRLTGSVIAMVALCAVAGCGGSEDTASEQLAVRGTPEHRDISLDVVLRGVPNKIHADVYDNPRGEHGQLTILAVHGMDERGSMYQPLADAIYKDRNLRNRVREIIAIDLPGHGLSPVPTLPAPLKFGDLLIEDNASVVIQAIDATHPQWLMGHSMGGLTVELVQEMLLAQGSSLAEHGVDRATLIAGAPARGMQWTPIDIGLNQLIMPYIRTDPTLGLIIDPPVEWCGVYGNFLARDDGSFGPPLAACIANHWVSIEPGTTIAELTGLYCAGDPNDPNSTGLCRPFVRQGAFAPENGTRLMALGFREDVGVPIENEEAMYTYLTGITPHGEGGPYLYRAVTADDSVHSMYLIDPEAVVSAIRNGTP